MPSTAGHIARAVEVQGNADDLELANYLAPDFILDPIHEAVHGLRDTGEIFPKPVSINPRRHRLIFRLGDIDDSGYVADALIEECSMDCRDELVAVVFRVLVIFAILV